MSPADRTTVRVEPSEKRVRAYFDGEVVLDTINSLLVWNLPRQTAYFVPREDVRAELLVPSDHSDDHPTEGPAEFFDLVLKERVAKNAAWRYPQSTHPELRDRLRFDWYAVDGWFEEDEQVFFAPRDPYHRVDICPSSRHIEVQLDGVTIADSRNSRILFETNSPTRYYLPLVDIHMEMLKPSETQTRCPYKGYCAYWSIDLNGALYEDYVWSYKQPFFESLPIAGYAAFYNEKMDIYVDGVLDARALPRELDLNSLTDGFCRR